MGVVEILKDAIANRLQITARYQNHLREFCPHAIGWKDDAYRVIGYQFGGTSSRGLPAEGEWRCFLVSGLSDVSAKPGPWSTGAGHTRPNTWSSTLPRSSSK